MRNLVFTLLILFSCNFTFAQNIKWAVQAGGTGSDVVNAIANDQQGNAYATGYFGLTARFSHNNGVSLTSIGNCDGFLCKIGVNGNVEWVNQFGGTGADFGKALEVTPEILHLRIAIMAQEYFQYYCRLSISLAVLGVFRRQMPFRFFHSRWLIFILNRGAPISTIRS
ncbi:MAG: hypothetical protein KKD31_14150 [Bacteroidetes bacterium]|nr:hypothetical protein [Bacteroidota bacterium]